MRFAEKFSTNRPAIDTFPAANNNLPSEQTSRPVFSNMRADFQTNVEKKYKHRTNSRSDDFLRGFTCNRRTNLGIHKRRIDVG
ncbi:MAG TPA: hypothetical protein DE147_07595 [Gammaproteobacteria bacterium]|nr:hypothetical protein [Gammaproteobacteria bacterium]HCG70309.1 hypothetical protein [Gammaproteobacteria bacterium]